MQSGFQCQLFETDRVMVIGQDIEQLHHALDDLDRGLDSGGWGGIVGLGFCAGFVGRSSRVLYHIVK